MLKIFNKIDLMENAKKTSLIMLPVFFVLLTLGIILRSLISSSSNTIKSKTNNSYNGSIDDLELMSINSSNSSESTSSAIIKSKKPTKGFISINFDDGFFSAYENALPILEKNNVKATFYVITGRFDNPIYISQHELLDLQSKGQEIGAHTKSHINLTSLTEAQANDEIINSLNELKNIGIKSVSTFAYPFGGYNANIEKLVKQNGFIGARSTANGFNNGTTDQYVLKDFAVTVDTPFSSLQKSIDEAIKNHTWLIIVFHRIDEGDNHISANHEILQQVIDYAKSKNVEIITNEEGLQSLGH